MEPIFQNINEDKRANKLTFQLSPTHVAYANALRRLCMTHVESVGFRADMNNSGSTTDVEVLANSTPMTNEMLAHRIGLVPIHVKNPLEWNPDKYLFTLNKVNDTSDVMRVYASDFAVSEKNGDKITNIPSDKFFVPNEITKQTCLLAILKPLIPGAKAEEISIRAKATIGTGQENARFIPTSQCAYSYTRDTSKENIERAFYDWAFRSKKISEEVLKNDTAKRDVLMREFKTLEINRCYLKDEEGEPYSFDFTIESVGVLDCSYIVYRACEKGVELCKKYSSDNFGSSVVIQRTDGQLIGWDFIFQEEDHTLGHLIQAWIDKHHVGQDAITFAGYDIPHPLRDEMVIRIGVKDGKEATARDVMKKAMIACQGMFEMWRDQWSRLTGVSVSVESKNVPLNISNRVLINKNNLDENMLPSNSNSSNSNSSNSNSSNSNSSNSNSSNSNSNNSSVNLSNYNLNSPYESSLNNSSPEVVVPPSTKRAIRRPQPLIQK
jgi:DNA-directed RNA polymerase subunit L/DNA-directed RNA polymerase alpha subunit